MGGVGLSVERTGQDVVRPAAFSLPRIRVGRRADLDELADLERHIFGADSFAKNLIDYSLCSANQVVLVAEIGRVIVGSATIWMHTHSARLYSIGVHPDYRNRWIGFILMKKCERIARERGCTVVRLEVRVDNPTALEFYRRNHYKCVGCRSSYYGDGTAALKLEKVL